MDENNAGTKSDRDLALELKRLLDMGQNERSISKFFDMPSRRVKQLLKMVEDPPKRRRIDATLDGPSYNSGLAKAKDIIRQAHMANRMLTAGDLVLIVSKRIDGEMLCG